MTHFGKLLLFLVIVATVSCCFAASARTPVVAPEYTLNLNDPPQNRWKEIIRSTIALHGWDGTFGPLLDYAKQLMGKHEQLLVDAATVLHGSGILGEYGEEITGMVDEFHELNHNEYSVGHITCMQFIYEISAMCTSVVASSTANSTNSAIHGRNLDWEMSTFGNLTSVVNYHDQGKVLFRGVHPIGYLGVLTGMRNGAFSVSLDERDTGGTLIDNMIAAVTGGKSIGFLLRHVLMTSPTYENAVSIISSARIITPCYVIIAGVNVGEGSVITRDRNNATDIWKMTDKSTDNYFILETNYDHWLPPPASDDRRTPGIAHMHALGGSDNVTHESILAVMSTEPTLNDTTVFTAVMEPKLSYMNVVVWM